MGSKPPHAGGPAWGPRGGKAACARRALITCAGLLAALVGAVGCSSPQSFVVLVLESSAQPIVSVDHFTIIVTLGSAETQTLTYPAGSLSLVADANVNQGTLSVSFSGNQTGDATFAITASDGHGCEIGTGKALVTIRKGSVNEAIVPLAPEMKCTGADGGAPDLAPDTTFPGCDLTMAATACPATQTCAINCTDRANVCAAAGTVPAGGACGVDAGCAAGSQCFGYSGLGCQGVQLCLRYCNNDSDCAPLAGGVGPGSFCRNPVACNSVNTAYHTCSFSCDPTAAAAASGATGCPAGLACVMPASMDHVDCTCPEATRTGKENTACTSTSQCAPGLLCEQTCRAVCRCNAQNGACTATNDCPTAGTTCHAVSGETIYGVCLQT